MSQPLTIVVPVKHVPDAAGDRVLAGSPPLLERASGILSELDEYALEAAVQIVETHGGAAAGHRVLALTLGPAGATGAIKRALQLGADAGFHVRTASNGLEALLIAYEMRPAVILMDVTMPILDGVEATRLIKAIDEIRQARVIAYTGRPATLDDAATALFAAVLPKPSSPAAVVATVRQHAAA